MEVTSCFECLYHPFAVGHMCEHSELQLSVIGHNQLLALLSHEGLPDLVLILIESRLILEVWLSTRKSSRLRVEIHAAMDTASTIRGALEWAYVGRQQSFNLLKLKPARKRLATLLAFFLHANVLKVIVSFSIVSLLRVAGKDLDYRPVCRGHAIGSVV